MRIGASLVKRRRFMSFREMDSNTAKAKLDAVKEKLGREIHVFETLAASPTSSDISRDDESDDFYEFTPEDYYRILSKNKEERFLKTRKIREAEEAARRSRITKAVIRVRFPDNYTLEATFHPSETLQSLVDLLKKVIARPDLPFLIYTTPPKKLIKDMSQDLYSAGFIPGAIVYFSYDLLRGDETGQSSDANSVVFLQEEIRSLNGLHFILEQAEPVQSAPEPSAAVTVAPPPDVSQAKPAEKKPTKPKWFKM
ncbi:hypothetical protein Syun_024405 [Stephania yunnanensis]|uniref:UBX domain-containing protein n=1 Tax=Stephania yunnanensis TaxID=152371 RepID=A0AAP0I4C0_9MAGN